MKKEKTKYIAYGSNLNLKQMAIRCPTAKPVGTAMLEGWQLIFKSVATLEPCEGAVTPIAIWELEDSDEVALDRYEGFPRFYRKEYLNIEVRGKAIKAMIYLMNDGTLCMPSKWYLDAIAQGYEDVGLDTVHITKALELTQERLRRKPKD